MLGGMGFLLCARYAARQGSFATPNVGPLARLIGFIPELQRSARL